MRVPTFVYIMVLGFPVIFAFLIAWHLSMGNYAFAGLIGGMLIIFCVVSYFSLRNSYNYSRLLRNGIRGKGYFVDAKIIGKGSYNRLKYRLELEIEVPDKQTWRAFTKSWSSIIWENQMVPGYMFEVMVDPKDPTNVVIINSTDLKLMNSPFNK